MYIVYLKYKRFKRDMWFMYFFFFLIVILINGNVFLNDVFLISLVCFFSEMGEIVKNIFFNFGLF